MGVGVRVMVEVGAKVGVAWGVFDGIAVGGSWVGVNASSCLTMETIVSASTSSWVNEFFVVHETNKMVKINSQVMHLIMRSSR